VATEVDALAETFLAAVCAQDPVWASLLGLPGGDDRLADLSASAERETGRRYEHVAARADDLATRLVAEGGRLDEDETETLDFVRHAASNLAAGASVPLAEFTITDFHAAPLAGLLTLLPQLPLDSADRADGYLARLAALPRFLEQATERHLDGIAAGRLPVASLARSAIEQLDDVIADRSLNGLRRPADARASDDFVDEEDRIIDQSVLPALGRYRCQLAEQILPHGRDDGHPGLCWLPDGAVMYERLTRLHTSTDRSADELHTTGLALVEQLDAEYATIGSRLWGTSDVAEIRRQLRDDLELRYTSGEEILAEAAAAVRRAEHEAPRWFASVPEAPCAVEAVPAALAHGSPPAYYLPGAVDGSRNGAFFVNTSQPGARYRYLADAIAFHEAVPGHHLQLTVAQDQTALPLARRVVHDTAAAEGWGLYAERLADEMGLYSGDLTRLGMLSTDSWRAARLVVDTGLHALGWSRQTAVDWMRDHTPIALLEIESEVDRYIAFPAQALSYMVGRLELESCRLGASRRLGSRFDLRAFHDLVLRIGPVPLPVLSAAVDRWARSPAAGSA